MAYADANTSEEVTRLETQLQARVGSLVRDLRVEHRDGGIILRGQARTYYAKQIATHAAIKVTNLPVLANEINVR